MNKKEVAAYLKKYHYIDYKPPQEILLYKADGKKRQESENKQKPCKLEKI